uniref:Histone-lysine N-methyltransferase n=1 Tax=Syphacia muris TaxID=451379 RepID=A0A0N5ACV2_9BILA
MRRFDMIKYVERLGKTSLFIVDALERGNIGRFFNHSCSPNMRIVCVFVDTHDFRLPWISFFTTKSVKAGEELCWDYGYTEGTVAGKSLRCLCGSKRCRKRLNDKQYKYLGRV